LLVVRRPDAEVSKTGVLGANEMSQTAEELSLSRKGRPKDPPIDLSPRDAKRLAGYESETKWVYDNSEVRDLLHKGRIRLDEKDMVKTFLEWKDEECHINFRNEETDEFLEVLSPKRGNPAYARNKRRKASEIYQGMKKLDWDYPVPHARNLVRDTHLLLITATFDRKKITKEEAWRLLTSKGKALNRYSANLEKIFGSKATWKVKEATKSGYPAPHILVILDKPVRAFRYKMKWRIQSERVLDRLRRAWPYGYIDVLAVISSKVGKHGVVYYLMKYLTKSISFSYKNSDSFESEQWESEKGAIKMHVWNKVFRCRDVLSKAFKQRLNSVRPLKLETNSSERKWSLCWIDYRISLLRIRVSEQYRYNQRDMALYHLPVDSIRSRRGGQTSLSSF
jgi:hypothetical protein